MQKLIFILEDDIHIGYVLELFLRTEGYNVSLCKTIAELDLSCSKALSDLFILDIMVPDGNGMHYCTALKQHSRTKNIPVVLMSAHLSPDRIEEQAGADAFLSKPFDLDKIAGLIEQFVLPN